MGKPTREVIAAAIKAAVDATGDTITSVGEAAGLAGGHLSRYYSGESMPTIINAWKLADELGLSLDQLVGRKFPR